VDDSQNLMISSLAK